MIDWDMMAVDIALGRRITMAEARDWIRIFLDSPPYGFSEFIETYKVKQ